MMVVTVLFQVKHPDNSRVLQAAILKLCSFDFFHTEEVYNKIFNFKTTSPFNPEFEKAGIENRNFILGIGPIFLSMLAFPCYVIVHKVMHFIFEG